MYCYTINELCSESIFTHTHIQSCAFTELSPVPTTVIKPQSVIKFPNLLYIKLQFSMVYVLTSILFSCTYGVKVSASAKH